MCCVTLWWLLGGTAVLRSDMTLVSHEAALCTRLLLVLGYKDWSVGGLGPWGERGRPVRRRTKVAAACGSEGGDN